MRKSPHDLIELLDEASNRTHAAVATNDLADIDQIAAVRRAYRTLGKDPSRYRGAAEALVRRIMSGKPLYHINNVVDVNNLISLRCLHPVGSYDAEHISQEFCFRLGLRSESYEGIGKHVINTENLPVLADMSGAFGSPTSDSERTMILPTTRTTLTAIMSFRGPEQLVEYVHTTATFLQKFADASIIEERVC